MSDEQMLELIQQECQGLNSLGAREHIADHYEDGKVIRVRPGKQIDPQKLAPFDMPRLRGNLKLRSARVWEYQFQR